VRSGHARRLPSKRYPPFPLLAGAVTSEEAADADAARTRPGAFFLPALALVEPFPSEASSASLQERREVALFIGGCRRRI